MTPQTKQRILSTLSSTSLYLGLIGMLPYFLGDVADLFPPEVKKYVTIIGVFGGAATKAIERIIAHLNKLP